MRRNVRRVAAGIVVSAAVLAAIRASGIRLDTAVRQFNKHLLNPVALRIIARRKTYYSVLHHVGRHSGKPYATPVVARSTSEGIVIPLPYGPNTDWCRNVLAADGCTLSMNGTEYTLRSPRVILPSEAEPLLPHVNARLWQMVGMKHYLLLSEAGVPQLTKELVAA